MNLRNLKQNIMVAHATFVLPVIHAARVLRLSVSDSQSMTYSVNKLTKLYGMMT